MPETKSEVIVAVRDGEYSNPRLGKFLFKAGDKLKVDPQQTDDFDVKKKSISKGFAYTLKFHKHV